MTPRRWWVVGPGRLGAAWARLLLEEDPDAQLDLSGRRPQPPPTLPPSHRWRYRTSRSWPAPPPEAVLLTVPDRAIVEVAAALAEGLPAAVAVLHCAGALGVEALAPLAARGASVGVLHPLAAVVGDPDALRGAYFTLEATGSAAAAANHLVRLAGGRLLPLVTHRRGLYHAAATLAAAGAATVVARAAAALVQTGAPATDARRALVHLARTALDALTERSPAAALTGPAVRGDTRTVAAHLAQLSPSERRLYCLLTREALALLAEAGLATSAHAEVGALLETACECDST